MRKRLPWFLLGIPLLGMIIANILLWPDLADRVAIHWNAKGEVNAWGGRASVWLLPAMYLVLGSFLHLTTKRLAGSHDPDQQRSVNWILGGLALLFIYLHAQVLLTATRPFPTKTLPLVTWGIASFIIFAGLAFKTIKRNSVIGIRTKWSLASDEIWDKTHQFASSLFFIAGVVMALKAHIFSLMVWVGILVALSCLAAFYSYYLHRISQRSSTRP